MITINQALLKLDAKLQEDNKINDYLKKAEEFSGIERRKIVIGGSAFLASLVIIGYGAQLISNLVGFAYPAYASILAVESKQKEDDTLWLTYWVVFAGMSIAEFFSDFILCLIPFYWLLKCVFLIWCFLPFRMNGSRVIYYNFIRPVFLTYLEKPDVAVDGISSDQQHEKEQ